MSLLKAIGGASGSVAPKLDASDVFSTYLRTGTGADVVTTTGIDMTQGYLLWSKGRSSATDHALYDSSRGLTKDLVSNSTAAETTQVTGLKAVSTTGHTIGSLAKMNTSGATYVDHVFREQQNFFHQELKVHVNGTASTVDLSTLGTVGMVTVKSTVNTSNWFTWHRSLTTGNNLKLNLTDAESATNAYLSVSGTTLTIASTAPSDTYIVYAWAHDTTADGIIQCGGYVGNGATGQLINFGWEPQYIMIKASTPAGNTWDDWFIFDTMRGITIDSSIGVNILRSNESTAETIELQTNIASLGFRLGANGDLNDSGKTYIYMTIRRPNKVPTSGTEVYNAIARTGTGAAATVSGVGFAPDLVVTKKRSSTTLTGARYVDRLRGKTIHLDSSATTAEVITADTITGLDFMDGAYLGADATTSAFNTNTHTYANHFFKRAKEFFDEVCDTGTGSAHTIAHNLGKAPELWLRKGRSGATQWVWGSSLLANTEKVNMPTPVGKVTDANAWNSTYPTSTLFTVGTSADVNTNTATYVTYLFGSVVGVSKIGTFTGNGTSQTINCGFTGGARFVLIFRTDASGEFYIWDTVRGIVAGNDPHLSLNTTAAEVTTDDSIDPEATGFIVNQVAATNVNVTSATYIYLAIS